MNKTLSAQLKNILLKVLIRNKKKPHPLHKQIFSKLYFRFLQKCKIVLVEKGIDTPKKLHEVFV